MSAVHHQTIEVPWGVVHARTGTYQSGTPTVLLHQTPRSGDEFREVIEGLGADRWLLALDLPGMGHSTAHSEGDTITGYAAGIVAAVDKLGIDRFCLVGHHTGAAVAAQIAADNQNRITTLVLSSPPWIDEATRQARLARTGPGVDEVAETDDGDHLGALWSGRAGFYPSGRRDLLNRFVADALLVADPGAGHRAVTHWQMEALLPTLRTVPVVLIDHRDDPHAHPNAARWRDALDNPRVVVIHEGMVPLEYTATAFVDALASIDPA